MTPFGKRLVSGVLYGLVLGLILWILGSALVVVIPSLPAVVTPLALFIIGWGASVGIAYADDAHKTVVEEAELEKKVEWLLKKAELNK